jgi:flagellar motility protein MotE (MotC chaperone)
MKIIKTLLILALVVAVLFSIDFLGFYPVGKKTIALLEKTHLKGPINTWELGVAREKEWENRKELLELEKEQLKQRQLELSAVKEELEAQRIKLSREAERTENLLLTLEKKEKQANAKKDQEKTVAQQATLFSKMKPAQAAGVIGQLELETAKMVLGKMDPRVAARILEQMEPYLAASLLP